MLYILQNVFFKISVNATTHMPEQTQFQCDTSRRRCRSVHRRSPHIVRPVHCFRYMTRCGGLGPSAFCRPRAVCNKGTTMRGALAITTDTGTRTLGRSVQAPDTVLNDHKSCSKVLSFACPPNMSHFDSLIAHAPAQRRAGGHGGTSGALLPFLGLEGFVSALTGFAIFVALESFPLPFPFPFPFFF